MPKAFLGRNFKKKNDLKKEKESNFRSLQNKTVKWLGIAWKNQQK